MMRAAPMGLVFIKVHTGKTRCLGHLMSLYRSLLLVLIRLIENICEFFFINSEDTNLCHITVTGLAMELIFNYFQTSIWEYTCPLADKREAMVLGTLLLCILVSKY